MKIPINSALLLVDVQDSRAHISVYDGEEQQERLRYYHEKIVQTVSFFRQNKTVPIIHIIELHRDDLSDFGRELDGAEQVHCLEKDSFFWEGAAPAAGEYTIAKRRYSAFSGQIWKFCFAAKGLNTCLSAEA